MHSQPFITTCLLFSVSVWCYIFSFMACFTHSKDYDIVSCHSPVCSCWIFCSHAGRSTLIIIQSVAQNGHFVLFTNFIIIVLLYFQLYPLLSEAIPTSSAVLLWIQLVRIRYIETLIDVVLCVCVCRVCK